MPNNDNISVFMSLESVEAAFKKGETELLEVASSIVFCIRGTKSTDVTSSTIAFLAKDTTKIIEIDSEQPKPAHFSSNNGYIAAMGRYWNVVNEEASRILGMLIDLQNPIFDEIKVKT